MILVVDDVISTCDDLKKAISRFGYEVAAAYSGEEALDIVENKDISFIVSDVHMPHMSGIELVEKLKDFHNAPPIILMSGVNDIIDSINAIEIGAIDFLPKPINIRQLVDIIKKGKQDVQRLQLDNALNSLLLTEIEKKKYIYISDYANTKTSFFCKPLGSVGVFSEKMFNIYNKLQKLHDYREIPIMIEGKTGTGKEVVAKFIHYDGHSKKEPFIAINCSTIAKDMFEAELFGYEKSSFTGASASGHEGFISKVGKGTLFLDEFTEIKPDVQAKLLRLLQEGEYFKLGGTKPQKNHARIICATNTSSEVLIKDGRLREDLYYRLSVCKVTLPELKERPEEILPLSLMFIRQFNIKFNKNIKKISSLALKRILEHTWNGNVRELENTLMKSILFINNNTLESEDILFDNFQSVRYSIDSKFSISFALPETQFNLNNFNLEIVSAVIKKFDGNKTRAAEFMGLTRSQMYNRYKVN